MLVRQTFPPYAKIQVPTGSVILMYSGGLDSLGAFYSLAETRVALHVHHIDILNYEERAPLESKAVANTLAWLRDKGYSFSYSSSMLNIPAVNGTTMFDATLTKLVAGWLAANTPDSSIAWGVTKTDDNDTTHDQRIRLGDDLLDLFSSAKQLYPIRDLTKKQVWELLPPDLRVLAWSCRKPIFSRRPCKSCKACLERAREGIPFG